MKEENIKLIIEGYNAEKLILSERLSNLKDCNATISTCSNITHRLRKIDEAIEKLTK